MNDSSTIPEGDVGRGHLGQQRANPSSLRKNLWVGITLSHCKYKALSLQSVAPGVLLMDEQK